MHLDSYLNVTTSGKGNVPSSNSSLIIGLSVTGKIFSKYVIIII